MDTRSAGVGLRVFGGISAFLEWLSDSYTRHLQGDAGGDGLGPEVVVQDPPYEEGLDDYEDDEDED